jgi:AraC-like DNA-binding protein
MDHALKSWSRNGNRVSFPSVTMNANQRLLKFLSHFRFEPLTIHRVVDSKKRLTQNFDPDFPLLMRLYSFPAYRQMLGDNWLNWHEHLELILPISGSGRFRSGELIMDFVPGDLLLVDNLKLHGMLDLKGEHRSLVIFFRPELIYNIASCQCDATFLGPFLERSATALPIIQRSDASAQPVFEALLKLVSAFSGPDAVEDKQALCKLHLLEALYQMRRHFQLRGTVSASYAQQRQRVQRLKRLFDFLQANCAEKLRLAQAAAMVGMSETNFKGFFKRATGTTFAQYFISLRLTRACQLLRETELATSEIALETGFCDQSHLDNRFKESFQLSPKEYRARHRKNP